ncbi:MAG: amidase [Hyphomicrobiales bacterium]|nr:amidase [Hyphomicrobiales bacterium]MCP5370659.1 amidase [Hyphomicrobiales bacterium]
METTDLADLSAAQLARLIDDGVTTATEVVEASLARIEARDGQVQAWTFLDPDHARAQAQRLDALRAAGGPVGPLHGVPVGVKDIFDTADMPTENGTVLDAGRQPRTDSAAVALLRAAGAVIMGKTVTTEMAVYAPGKTRNPHDPSRTPGGSSSGSAAAVAAGMVPVAVGTQTNGSVIRPASFCGIVGYKPTHGRISRAGILPLSRGLDQVGVFARSVEDAALIAECLMAHDPADPDTRPRAAPRLAEIAAQEPPAPPRLAFFRTPVWDRAEAATREAFEELRDFLGDACHEIDLPPAFDRVVDDLKAIMFTDLARNLAGYVARGEDRISDILRGMMDEGRTVTALDYTTAVERMAPLNAWLADLGTDFDAFLTPATPGEAPVGDATGDPVFCTIWSYLGVPAVSLPLMQGEAGMPLGVQLVAPRGDDGRLLRNGRWLAQRVAEDA